MRIAVLGTGIVGRTIGSKLIELGHEVSMGSRTPDNEDAAAWVSAAGSSASHGTFADAAASGELLINCVSGGGSLDALASVDADDLSGKVLIDIADPLDFSQGFPPSLSVCNTDSLGERIQAAFPDLRVVKTLNTMNCVVMVDPARVPGDHHVFLSGNDPVAKTDAMELLRTFGWRDAQMIDLGDITTARGTEMYLALWVRLYGALGTGDFNIEVRR